MSLQFGKDTGKWRVRFKRTGPDGKLEDIRVTLENVSSERAERKIERALVAAIRYKGYRYLGDECRRSALNSSTAVAGLCLLPLSPPWAVDRKKFDTGETEIFVKR